MKTYIIKTKSNEYYCGKTSRKIQLRLDEHLKEKAPHWFGYKDRKNWSIVISYDGDHEKNIKRFGVKKFLELEPNVERFQ